MGKKIWIWRDVLRCTKVQCEGNSATQLICAEDLHAWGENLAAVIGICRGQVLRLSTQNHGRRRLSRALLSCWSNQQHAYIALIWLYMYVLHFENYCFSSKAYTFICFKMWICWVLFTFLLFKLSQQTPEFLFNFPKLLRIWLSNIQTIQNHVPVNPLPGLTVYLMFQVHQYQLSCECGIILNWIHLAWKDCAVVIRTMQWEQMYWKSFMFKQIGRQIHTYTHIVCTDVCVNLFLKMIFFLLCLI